MTRPVFRDLLHLAIVCALLLGAWCLLVAGVASAQVTSAAPAAAAATSAVPVDPAADPMTIAKGIGEAVHGKHWIALIGGVVLALVWAARKWGGQVLPWLDTDRGGAVLALGAGVLCGVAMWLVDGKLTLDALWTAGLGAIAAAGGRNLVSRIMAPKDMAPKLASIR